MRRLADNLGNMYIVNHNFRGLLHDKYKLLCFDILRGIFIGNKWIIPKDFSITNLCKYSKVEIRN